jgi:arsenate reductase
MIRIHRVLFLCTRNSARSILAECVLNRVGQGRFEAVSAGSAPKGQVHPLALEVLESAGYATSGLRSKSWDEFSATAGARLDFVITLCDSAASEACPLWLGDPVKVHWGLPDPAAVVGNEPARRAAFEATLQKLTALVTKLVELPPPSLDDPKIRGRLEAIGC